MLLKNFLKMFSDNMWVDIYVDGELSLLGEMNFTRKMLQTDPRGKLTVDKNRTDFVDNFCTAAGKRIHSLKVYCSTK